jgi:hypothetical protein
MALIAVEIALAIAHVGHFVLFGVIAFIVVFLGYLGTGSRVLRDVLHRRAVNAIQPALATHKLALARKQRLLDHFDQISETLPEPIGRSRTRPVFEPPSPVGARVVW